MVEDLVDVIERVLLIDNGVEEDAERPDVLFLATIGLALQNLGGSVVYMKVRSVSSHNDTAETVLPIVPTKTSKGPFLI